MLLSWSKRVVKYEAVALASALVLAWLLLVAWLSFGPLLFVGSRTHPEDRNNGLHWALARPQAGPQWSRDGKLIVFGHEGSVYSVRPDGSGLRLLAGNPADRFDYSRSPTISPVGSRIAYAACKHDSWLPSGTEYRWEIVTSALDGSDRRTLTKNDNPRDVNVAPVWSPDGAHIAFLSSRDVGSLEVYTMAPDGSDIRNVAPSITAMGLAPVWSPDGRFLAFVGSNRDADPDDRAGVYVVGVDGTGLRKLKGWTGPIQLEKGVPAWSADGNSVAFVRHDLPDDESNEGDVRAILATDLDGSNLRTVFDYTHIVQLGGSANPLGHLSWSPDGRVFLFSNEAGQLGVVGADGSAPRLIAHLRHGLLPRFNDIGHKTGLASWSPDASSIVVHVPITTAGSFDAVLFTMNADGTNRRVLARYEHGPDGTGKVVPASGRLWRAEYEEIAYPELKPHYFGPPPLPPPAQTDQKPQQDSRESMPPPCLEKPDVDC